jgi:penicillin-binding protein 1A
MRDELEILRQGIQVPLEGKTARGSAVADPPGADPGQGGPEVDDLPSEDVPVRRRQARRPNARPHLRALAPAHAASPADAPALPGSPEYLVAPEIAPQVAPAPPPPPGRRRGASSSGRPRRRVRKLRLLLILTGLGILALISLVFGMLLAVASDLPQLENTQQFATGRTSYLYDDHGRPIGPLLSPVNHEVIDNWKQISPAMVHAIIAVEDKRFWSDPGVDLRGVARAVLADLTGGATQGASTIAEQFVKNTLKAEGNRTVFEKLREAALAFQLTHKWTRVKILTEYLNSIYFGHGAYGVESASRVYFGQQLGYDPNAPSDGGTSRCGDSIPGHPVPSCASQLKPAQAALLAGMVANPSAFDPLANPRAARARRDLVLSDMLQQGYITRAQYLVAMAAPLPTAATLQQPEEPAAAPYFTSWLRPQILRAMGYGHGVSESVAEYRAYYGGLKIKTTLDLRMQHAADQAVSQVLPFDPAKGLNQPVASLVAINNANGQVRAMVGGPVVNGQEAYQQYPFNLATESERQPGSAFKAFTLAVALESGFTPSSVFLSAPANFVVPNSGGKEIFHVRNFGDTYSGPITLQEATDISDNSVFSRLGIIGLAPYGGTKRIARLAKTMGIRTPVSTNDAMILGGLKVGVSPLDMAHAYETLATLGRKVYDPVLGDVDQGPTGIAQIQCPSECPRKNVVDRPVFKRVLPASVAQLEGQMLQGPVQSGTATAAAIPGVVVSGKTGTTTNYGDAWFVGWTPQLTVAVWVGFPNSTTPMSTLFNGGPVEGGTFPALIWHAFMVQALQILASEQAGQHQGNTTSTQPLTTLPATTTTPGSTGPSTAPTTTSPPAPTQAAPTTPAAGGAPGGTGQSTPPPGGGTGSPGGGTGSPGGGTGNGSGTGSGSGGGNSGGGGVGGGASAGGNAGSTGH